MSNNFTNEQINKIKVGKTYTSWKQLCEEGGIPYKKGGTNQSYQKLELFRFFDYEQFGRRYTILIKREFPLLKTDGTKSPYRKILQLLILDLIANDKEGKVSLTQDNLFVLLAMVNNDFNKYRSSRNTEILSTELDISKRTIDIFYSRHSSRFKDMISGALNSLQSQFVLSWNKTDRIAYKDYTSMEMTDLHRRILVTCKSDIAEMMGKESEQDIFMSGMYNEFMKNVVLEFNAATGANAKYFYSTYDILYNMNSDYVDKKRRKIYDKLESQYKIDLQNDLNEEIVSGTIDNVKNRTMHQKFIDNEIVLTEKLISRK